VPTCEHLFLVQIFDFWDIFWATIYEKSLTERSVRDFCGEDENRKSTRLISYLSINNILPIFAPASRVSLEERQPSSQKPRWQSDADCSTSKKVW